MTNDLAHRVFQHKSEIAESFSKKYKTKMLVYYETCDDIKAAIQREKQLKRWRRDWKIDLIHKDNRMWRDLYHELNA